ncbi:PhzF family phenazine biosynthesis protein [Hoeflea alexandrii]|uniref:PhzF family phenazine biosynthesis protein n=1 Tax=Hoeflea alexandrii TaxID=288436 RepID=UPI0035CF1F9E
MRYAFRTVDVFTTRRFGGNQLAVILDADGLETAQMQEIAREFNYSETAFVLRPHDPGNTARVRIFTPATEVPFAGHPNVGTGHVLASLQRDGARPESFVFEEEAGLVPVSLRWSGGEVEEVRLTAPQSLSTGSRFSDLQLAACLSLDVADIATGHHQPLIASIGLPFLVVEIASRAALRAARPDIAAISQILPAEGADAIYLYCREIEAADGEVDLTARMFAPWDGVPEDPATGSATGAACALIAGIGGSAVTPVRFRVAQGVDMGRPSLIAVEVDVANARVSIGGACVPVLSGEIEV